MSRSTLERLASPTLTPGWRRCGTQLYQWPAMQLRPRRKFINIGMGTDTLKKMSLPRTLTFSLAMLANKAHTIAEDMHQVGDSPNAAHDPPLILVREDAHTARRRVHRYQGRGASEDAPQRHQGQEGEGTRPREQQQGRPVRHVSQMCAPPHRRDSAHSSVQRTTGSHSRSPLPRRQTPRATLPIWACTGPLLP